MFTSRNDRQSPPEQKKMKMMMMKMNQKSNISMMRKIYFIERETVLNYIRSGFAKKKVGMFIDVERLAESLSIYSTHN